MKKVQNKLQVRHYPQIPCKPFCVDVADEYEAKKISDVLADQHNWLFKHKIIPDYSNSIIVVMWDDVDGEGKEYDWVDYWNEEECAEWDDIERIIEEEKQTEDGHIG